MLLMLVCFASAAQAQTIPVICQPHKVVADKLLKEFDEVLVAHGLAGSRLLELYASRDGTFTVLLTRTDGLSCIQGAGTNFILTHNEYPPAWPARPGWASATSTLRWPWVLPVLPSAYC